jgi:hypothetical protein
MHVRLLTRLPVLAAALGLLVANPVTGAADVTSVIPANDGLPTNVGSAHVFWQKGHYTSQAQLNQDQLLYHGGTVETTPAVYFVFWGPSWQSGFSSTQGGYTYTNSTVENYLAGFFGNIGGSPWNGVQTQYCQGAAIGAVNCNGVAGSQFVGNPKHMLKGVWVDPSPVPNPIVTTALVENTTNDPVAQEALKASDHFGYNVNATYFIFTEPGIQATAYGSVYCAYHSETGHALGSRGTRYAFVPYVPEQGAGCGENSVNATNDAYGNGYLDGYSIVAGHEFAEAETDPDNFNGTQDGWNDAQTSENGDKCAWMNTQNITLGTHFYAVQPMWSNNANSGQGGCVVS